MRQVFHIFKKDVRGLAYEIVVTLLLVAAFVFAESHAYIGPLFDQPAYWWTMLVKIALPLNWWILAGRVVHSEAIQGDRQFWITRPYSWKILLAAKIAFLAVFICVPLAISDVIILYAQGFSPASLSMGILWEIVLRFDFFVLSGMFLACLTGGLGSMALLSLSVVVMIAVNSAYDYGRGPSALDWVLNMLEMTLIPAAILWQYARRKNVAMVLAGCVVLLPFLEGRVDRLSPRVTVAKSSGGPALQIELEANSRRSFVPTALKGDDVRVALPVEISGIPRDLEVRARWVAVTLENAEGVTWKGNPDRENATISRDRSAGADPRAFWVEIRTTKKFYEQMKFQDSLATIHIWADLNLYGDLRPTVVGEGEVAVRGVGYCRSLLAWETMTCRAALRQPRMAVFDSLGYWMPVSNAEAADSRFPAMLGISPMITVNTHIDTKDVEVITGDPVYRVSTSAELRAIRLEDFVERISSLQARR
jgi:hypothetical protein